MSRAALLALGAGAAGVAGAWEVLAAVQREQAAAWLVGALRPLRRAAGAGATPSRQERRRLALLLGGCLLAAGWIVLGPVAGVAAAVLGPAAATTCVRVARGRYRGALAAGAADSARALAASLAAGRSIRTAVADAAAGLDGPAAAELGRTAAALGAGEPTDGALEALRVRAGTRAWDMLVAAILLQREAGGDLAGLLRDLAAALDEAERADRDARAATSQARFTAFTVAGLPLVAAVLAELADPGFVGGLLGRPLSAFLAGVAAVLQAAAMVAIRAINRGVERAA
jgi:tight adherence protein B